MPPILSTIKSKIREFEDKRQNLMQQSFVELPPEPLQIQSTDEFLASLATLGTSLFKYPALMAQEQYKRNEEKAIENQQKAKELLGESFVEFDPMLGGLSTAKSAPKVFKGFKDLSTKLLEKLKGRSTVSKQFISDLTNSPDLKQAERDLIRRVLDDESSVPQGLRGLVQSAKNARDEAEFVSSSVFDRSLTGEEKRSLSMFDGETVADQLGAFYKKATKGGDIDVPTFANKVKSELLLQEVKNFTRDATLRGENALIQERAIEKYVKNKDQLVQEYISQNGRIVNTDEARKLFNDVGYRGVNAAAVQEPSSALAKDVWKTALQNEGKEALIYAGGSGSGKTSAVRRFMPETVEKAAAILDGNLSTIKSARSRIAEAEAAGKTPKIVYVYRNPLESFVEGVIKRSKQNKAEGGRIVPTRIVAENHVGAYNVTKELLEEGKYGVELVNNNLGYGAQRSMTPAEFRKISFPKNLLDKLNKAVKTLYEREEITKEELDAYLD